MKKTKKIIISIVSIVLTICLITGGVFVYRWNSMRKNPVSVISVSSINNSWYGDPAYNGSLFGTVTKGRTQSVYYDSALTIKELLVNEGDAVAIGTPIIKYDTTLLNLQLQLKENDIQTIDLRIEALRKRLVTLRNTNVIADAGDISGENDVALMSNGSANDCAVLSATVVYSNIPLAELSESTESVSEGVTEESIPVLSALDDKSVAYKGIGTDESPFCFRIIVGAVIESSFITKAVADKCVCEIEVVADENSADVLYTWTFNGRDVMEAVTEEPVPEETLPTEPETNADETEPDEPITDEPIIDEPIIDEPIIDEPIPDGMTKDELDREIRAAESELVSLGYDRRAAELEYQRLKNKLTDGVLLSTVNGVVGEIIDESAAASENKPIMTISSEGGTFVEGHIGENSLGSISVGQKASIMSYFTGDVYDGVVIEVSDMADDEYANYSSQSESYYKFTVLVIEGAKLNEYDSVDITLVSNKSESGTLYIDKAYVREENGIHYTYIVGADGRLKKQPVKTGRVMDGYAIEIFEGLFESDYIAFPYGKNVKEGALVVVDDNGMYY